VKRLILSPVSWGYGAVRLLPLLHVREWGRDCGCFARPGWKTV